MDSEQSTGVPPSVFHWCGSAGCYSEPVFRKFRICHCGEGRMLEVGGILWSLYMYKYLVAPEVYTAIPRGVDRGLAAPTMTEPQNMR